MLSQVLWESHSQTKRKRFPRAKEAVHVEAVVHMEAVLSLS